LNEDRIENKLSEDDVQSKLKLLGRKTKIEELLSGAVAFVVRYSGLDI
jgi:hypothetical protein